MTYELPIAQEIDYSNVDKFKDATAELVVRLVRVLVAYRRFSRTRVPAATCPSMTSIATVIAVALETWVSASSSARRVWSGRSAQTMTGISP